MGTFFEHLRISLLRVGMGFGIGTTLGLLVGVMVGLLAQVERLLDPTLQAIRNVPSLAWVPFLLLWMGIDEMPKVTLIAIGTFFPVYINVVTGIRRVDRRAAGSRLYLRPHTVATGAADLRTCLIAVRGDGTSYRSRSGVVVSHGRGTDCLHAGIRVHAHRWSEQPTAGHHAGRHPLACPPRKADRFSPSVRGTEADPLE